METEISYNKELAVVQANELVRSRQDDLSLLEAKLIRLAISQVLMKDTDLKTYKCNVTDLAEYLHLDKKNIYRDIQELTKSIMKKSIFIRSKTGKRQNYETFHWIDYVKYEDGIITFRLSESLKPYLIGLHELFTRYEYDIVIALPTNNAIRLYELLSSYQNITLKNKIDHSFTRVKIGKNEFHFSIEWLREYFNCREKYPNTGDFIKRIITPSIQAIEKHTLMRIEYRTIKEKRSITGIVFKLNNWDDTPEEANRILSKLEREAKEDRKIFIGE